MDNTLLLYLLIAGAVGLLGYGLTIVFGGPPGERKRLQERLNTDAKPTGSPILPRSVIIQMETGGIDGLLLRYPYFQRMYRKLLRAFPEVRLSRFLMVCLGVGMSLGLVTYTVVDSPGGALAALAAGMYAPFFMASMRRNKRQRILADQLPEALDFLSRILRAGHSLSTGLQMMSEELPQPLATEFRRCYDQHSLGQALEDSLKDMAARIESTDFAFFITAVLIQRQTGGDLSEVLNNISGVIRGRIRLQNHVKAKTAEGRFTGYILVAFPAVMFFLCCYLNPNYSQKLLHTNEGLELLGVSFFLQMLGLFCIRKITTVKV